MHWITNIFVVLLCTFLKSECLLFHGQTNTTSASNGHSNPDVYKQLLHLETVLDSILMDQKQQALKIQQFEQQQKLLEGEMQTLNRTAQMKISFLESENKILKERMDNLNSSATSSQHEVCLNEKVNNLNSTSMFLFHENIILKDQMKILNSTSMLIQQNMTTQEDLQRLENILTFEIEQTVRDREQKIMKNMSATIKDLELRDRYLSLSLLDVHNNTAGLSSSLSSLEQKQTMMKSEIKTLSNSQQNNFAKLNDTIIHLKNRVQSNVAFTAGITGEDGQHTYAHTVKFPRVIYQVGGGYNPTTGVFTAPKAGLYLIFCTNVAYNHNTFWTTIMINGSVKAGVMAYIASPTTGMSIYQSASNLVVHQLQVGDRVWIQVYSGSHLYSTFPDTTFSVLMINGSD